MGNDPNVDNSAVAAQNAEAQTSNTSGDSMSPNNDVAELRRVRLDIPINSPDPAVLAAQTTPKTLAAMQVLQPKPVPSAALAAPGPSSPTNAAPTFAPGSFSERLSKIATDLFGVTGGKGGTRPVALAALGAMGAGSKTPPDNTAPTDENNVPVGRTPWATALSGNDRSRPSPVALPPQPAPAVTGVRNILGSFAAGAAHQGSPFGAVVANVNAQNEQMKDALTNASTWLHSYHEQQVLHSLGEQQVAAGVDSGNAGLKLMLSGGGHPGTLLVSGKTSDEIKDMIAKKQIDTTNSAVFLTGRVQVGTDKDGSPIYRSTYSVATPGGPITFDEEHNTESERNFINDKLGLKEGQPGYIPVGAVLPAAQVNRLYTQAQLADANEAAAEESMARNDQKRTVAFKSPDTQKLINSDALAKALTDTAAKGDPSDPDHLAKAYWALLSNPAALQQLGMSAERFKQAFANYAAGDDAKAWDTMLANYQKSREKMEEKANAIIGDDKEIAAHPEFAAASAQYIIQQAAKDTAAQRAIIASPTSTQAQKDAATAQIAQNDVKAAAAARTLQIAQDTITDTRKEKVRTAGDEEAARQNAKNHADIIRAGGVAGLSGDAYLATLPTDLQNSVKAVAEGRETRSPRQLLDKNGNLTAFAKILHTAYPDFDIQKASHYGDAVKEFQSSKSGAGKQLNAGATALKHLDRLAQIQNDNPTTVRIHGTAANVEYNNLLDTVAGELLDFYGEPKTNETIKAKKSTLGSFFNREAAIQEQARAMTAKFESLEQTWNNAAPRPSFRPPMPQIDESAKAAARRLVPDFAQDHPQLFGTGVAAPSAAPTTTTNTATKTPAGASNPVYAKDGKTLIGHVVNNKFVALGAQ